MTLLIVAATGALLFVLSLLLPLLARRVGAVATPELDDADGEPLTVLIPAYKEASVIGHTIGRLRAQLTHWPGESFVVVAAADAETRTVALKAGADEVLDFPPQGKADAVNRGVAHINRGVIALTDANCELRPDTWPLILSRQLRKAHLVSGQKGEAGGREGVFWRYEALVKGRPSTDKVKMSTTLAVVGEFLAFRARDYSPIRVEVLSDDLAIATSFAARNRVVVNSSEIHTSEEQAGPRDQWERRIRIAAGQLEQGWGILLLTPKLAAARAYVCHKLYRLTAGVAGFWTFVVATCVLGGLPILGFYAAIFAVAFLTYFGSIGTNGLLRSAATALVLQVIPPIALTRVLGRRLRPARRSGSWKKVAR